MVEHNLVAAVIKYLGETSGTRSERPRSGESRPLLSDPRGASRKPQAAGQPEVRQRGKGTLPGPVAGGLGGRTAAGATTIEDKEVDVNGPSST